MTGLNSKMWCVMRTRIGLFILQQFLHFGCLRIVIANGTTHSLKDEMAGPEMTIHLQSYRLFWRILLKPDLAIGAAYMDGSPTIANDDLEQLMALLMANDGHWPKHWLARTGLFAVTHLAFWRFFNLSGRAKRIVMHHYVLKDSLFDQFLDPRHQYSCSYFHTPSDTLADALWEMQPDISVTGITFSENQQAYATQKAKQDNRQQHLAISSMLLPASTRQF
jgi:cyclopropane-fatty-acyl-phospholipid synthase